MKLNPVDNIPNSSRAVKSDPILREFVDSGLDTAEVTDFSAKPRSSVQGLAKYAKDHDMPVKVVSRTDNGEIRVFLKRTDQGEDGQDTLEREFAGQS